MANRTIVKLLGSSAIATVFAMVAFPALSASAAPDAQVTQTATLSAPTTITITVTQAEINANPKVTQPNSHLSNVSIRLSDGQAQIDATYTGPVRTPNAVKKTATAPTQEVIQFSSVWSPIIRDSRIDWVFVSATENGQPTSADRVTDHRLGLADSVNDEVRQAVEAQFAKSRFHDIAVTVSASGVTVSADVFPEGLKGTPTPETVTVSQSQINANPQIKHHDPRFTDPNIVLLAGQAQVTSTFTGIDPISKANDNGVPVVSVWTPTVRDGRIDWVFVSGMVNGNPTTADFVKDHRFGLRDSVNDTVHHTIETQYASRIYKDTSVSVSANGVVVNTDVWTKNGTATPVATTAQ